VERWQDRHLSAQALSTYQTCALRFKFRYVDNLFWSKLWGSAPADRAALERGQAFHLMARRYYMGLDPAQLADPLEQKELEAWMQLLTGFLPRSFDPLFYPELELRLNRPDLKFMAKFDLVVVDPDGRATIFDWKTEKRMPRRSYLQKSAQTLVYRYMLCEAGGAYSPRGRFRPDEVTMIYWNPLFPSKWERMAYSETQFHKDQGYLQELSARILHTAPDMFLATTNEAACRSCEYQMVCHGRRSEQVETDDEESLLAMTLSWDLMP